MKLCLDVGNSHIFGGVFFADDIKLRFRYRSERATSDEIGVFLRQVLVENKLDANQVNDIAICSVVPHLDYSLRAACIKYFNTEPFILKPGVKTGLNIQIKNPIELGGDRIATSIAAIQAFPNKNILLIDFGTATTFDVITKNHAHCGGAIMPGIGLSMQSLENKTAKLPPVEIIEPPQVTGKSTITGIQSGIYYASLGACREIVSRLKTENFPSENCLVIGTGGFAHLFESQNLFDLVLPDLVLQGLHIAWQLNQA